MRTVPRLTGSLRGRSAIFQSLTAMALLSIAGAAASQTVLPADVKSTCAVSQTEFNHWFVAQGVEKDGPVLPGKAQPGLLKAGDVRKNYIMVGATYTSDGKAPADNIAGTGTLANSTMETFQGGSNCFDCHSGNMLGTKPDSSGFGGGLSHIWQPMQSLFPKQ